MRMKKKHTCTVYGKQECYKREQEEGHEKNETTLS